MTSLTQREKEVLIGITAGMTNQEIAQAMGMSIRRVGYIVTGLKAKLGDEFPKRKPGRRTKCQN